MKALYVLIGAVLIVMASACGNTPSFPTGPTGHVTVPRGPQLANTIIGVLDSSEAECDGVCQVTKYENYPAEPPSPTYFVQSYIDPCETKWGSPWHTTHLIWEGEPNDPWGPAPTHWCQQ